MKGLIFTYYKPTDKNVKTHEEMKKFLSKLSRKLNNANIAIQIICLDKLNFYEKICMKKYLSNNDVKSCPCLILSKKNIIYGTKEIQQFLLKKCGPSISKSRSNQFGNAAYPPYRPPNNFPVNDSDKMYMESSPADTGFEQPITDEEIQAGSRHFDGGATDIEQELGANDEINDAPPNGGFENLSGEKLRDFMMQQKPMGRPGKKSKGVSDNDRILDTLRDNGLDV